MDFRLLSPNSRAAAAQRRRERANSAAIKFFQGIHHKKKGWLRPVDIKMLLISVLRVNISDAQFSALMSTPLYVSLFGKRGTKRSSLKLLRIKMEKSDKASVRIPKEKYSKIIKNSTSAVNSVSAKQAHTTLKKCVLSSCRKEWYTRPVSRQPDKNLSKPVAPNTFGIRKDLTDFDPNASAAKTLRWFNEAGSSSFSSGRRLRTSYGRREFKTRDFRGGGAKGVMNWDAVGVSMTADQAQVQVSDTMRLHFGSITKAFRTADADKSGSLSPRELRCMLTRLGISVSDLEFNNFLEKYADVLQDGKIDYQEFASKFGGKSANSLIGMGTHKQPKYSRRSRRFSAEQALQLLAKKLKSHFRTVTAAFLAADHNHDGRLSWLELRDVLSQWQIMMSDSEYMRMVKMVIESFGAGQRTSSISLEQFKKSILGVAVAAAHDPGMLDRHKDYMIMHSIRNKKRSQTPQKTSLPGLGDDDLDVRSHRKRTSSKFNKSDPHSSWEKVVLPTI